MRERKLNPKKAPELACPRCGAMLEWIYRDDASGTPRRTKIRRRGKRPMAADDVELDRTEPDGPFNVRVTGKVYVHVCEYECPRCWTVLSRAQAVPFEGEPPADLYLPDPRQAAAEAAAVKMGQSRFDPGIFDC